MPQELPARGPVLAPDRESGVTGMDFRGLYRKYIRREGADKLLLWLEATDFFTAPASRFHESYEGGLAEHSVAVADAFRMYPLAFLVHTADLAATIPELTQPNDTF